MDKKLKLILFIIALCVFTDIHAQVKRNDLIGLYEGISLTKNAEEYKEQISLSFTLGEDGSFSILNMHYLTLLDGTKIQFSYVSKGKWIFVADIQNIVFAFSDNEDKTELISIKKKNGKYYSEKELKKFKSTAIYEEYVKPVDFFSKGIVVKSVSDVQLKADLLCLPNFSCTWDKKPLTYYSPSNPRIKERLEDKYNRR